MSRDAADRLKRVGFPKIKDSRWRKTKTISLLQEIVLGSVDIRSNMTLREVVDESLSVNESLNIDDSFALLSLAMVDRVYLLEVNSSEDIYITRDFFNSSFNVLKIVVKDGISVNILDKIVGRDALSYPLTILEVGRSASVNYTKISNIDGRVVDNTTILLNESAKISAFNFSVDTTILRNNLKVRLSKGSEASLNGLYIAKEGHVDNYLRVEHLDESISSQKYKGVVVDGVASFTGSIYMDRAKSVAKQLNKTLLLGSGEVNSRPELEILNDDVICSHGATVGSLDQNELFYLQSRGVSRVEAERLLLQSFIDDLLDGLLGRDDILRLVGKIY